RRTGERRDEEQAQLGTIRNSIFPHRRRHAATRLAHDEIFQVGTVGHATVMPRDGIGHWDASLLLRLRGAGLLVVSLFARHRPAMKPILKLAAVLAQVVKQTGSMGGLRQVLVAG